MSLVALQTGSYKALNGMNVKILDSVSENEKYPYITIGECNAEAAGTKTNNADNVIEEFHVWSRANGFYECKNLINEIKRRLSVYKFNEAGCFIQFIDVDLTETMREPDGITRHGIVRIKFRVSQE